MSATLCPLLLNSYYLIGKLTPTFTVSPVENLRYLGFFINRRLKWEHHVRTMCNRARASIKALMVLGNSIRGLSMANWRLVLNAVCLPVMTWGCQLWFKEGGTKGLVKMLQQVQNEMVKVVTGAFHTAPREPLLQNYMHASDASLSRKVNLHLCLTALQAPKELSIITKTWT
jgi:hypothetical protein